MPDANLQTGEWFDKVILLVDAALENPDLPADHKTLLNLLVDRHGSRVYQSDIVKELPHLRHRKHGGGDRQARQLVRDLRVIYNVPVAGGTTGYYFPATKADAEKYVKKLASETRGRIVSSKETYAVMRRLLDVEPVRYLESLPVE